MLRLLAAAFAVATSGGPSLTLPQAEELLRTRGFDALVAEASVAGAEGDVYSQSASPNPGLSGGWLSSQAVSTAQFAPTTGYSVGLTDNDALWDFLLGYKHRRKEVALAALRAAKAGKDDALRTLRFQLESAFLQALLATENLRVAEDVATSYQNTLRLSQLQFDKGKIGAGDLAQIATAKLEADQAVASARAGVLQARAALLVFLGEPSLADHSLPVPSGSLAYRTDAAPGITDPADVDRIFEEAVARRPDLLQAKATREQKERALSLARFSRLPEVTLSGGYSTQVNYQSTPVTVVSPPNYSVGLAFPLPLLYREKGEIRRAAADLRASQALEGKARATVRSDVESVAALLATAREEIERMEATGGLLEQAKKARDVEEFLYQKQAASLVDFLVAERTWVATSLEHEQDLANFWTAAAELREATADPSPLPLPEAGR